MADLRVLVVSPSPLARGGITALLHELDGITPIGAAGLVDAGTLAGQLGPDAVVLDVMGGDIPDLEAIATLAEAHPALPIVALGGRPATTAQALALGASALLPSEVDPPTLQAALVAAVQQLVTIPRSDLPILLPSDGEDENPDGPAPVLTPRELEVLQGMARGLTNRQIGLRLKISEHTVKFHAGAVLGKLDARSRTEAVARAIRSGWILL